MPWPRVRCISCLQQQQQRYAQPHQQPHCSALRNRLALELDAKDFVDGCSSADDNLLHNAWLLHHFC
jgi:hypothetical protein